MAFGDFFNSVKNKVSDLKSEVLKFKNKEFLHAAMAGASLISLADGSISSEEKQKMLRFIETNDALSIFKNAEVIMAFQEFVSQIEFDVDVGNAKAYAAIAKLNANSEASRLVMRMIIAIAAADGDFDTDERVVAVKIAKELKLNPREFDLN